MSVASLYTRLNRSIIRIYLNRKGLITQHVNAGQFYLPNKYRFDVGTMLRVFELNMKNPAFAQQKNN